MTPTCRSDHEPPVKVKLTNLWTGKAFVFASQKQASAFLDRDSCYIHHVIRSGELARNSSGDAYHVEVLR